MNKLFMIFVLTLAGQNLWASKARLVSLGQDNNGSHLIFDDRNIFLNPAYVKQIKSSSITGEWGDLNVTQANTTTNAEGGVILKKDRFDFAIQLGRQTDISNSINVANTALGAAGRLIVPQNSIDLIGGMDFDDLNVGLGVHYANSEEEIAGAQDKARYIALSGGVLSESFAANIRLDLVHQSEDKATDSEYDGDVQIIVGGHYILSQNSQLNADIGIKKFDIKLGTNTTGVTSNEAQVTYTHFINKSNDKLLFIDAGLSWADGKVKSTPSQNIKFFSLPVTLGVESPVTDWFTLRTSVQQTVILDKQEVGTTKTNNIKTTVVAAGASLQLDAFTLDGVFKGASSNGEFDASDLLSQVSLKYNF